MIFIGSGLIVSDVLRKLFRRKETNGLINWTDSYQRIMLGLSFYDIMWSFFLSFLGSWMTPQDTTWMRPQDTGWLMRLGNQATCTAQGFFRHFGAMGVAVGSLGVCFVLFCFPLPITFLFF